MDTLSGSLDPITFAHTLGGLISNVLLFIPLGIAVAAYRSAYRPPRLAVVATNVLVLSSCVELAQLAMNRGGVTSVDDVLANTLGASLGWLLVRQLGLFGRTSEPVMSDRASGHG